ncbi:hexokinase [Punctularia strigosozonata HHB-11173 SS5]|uniref:hexokinase n=1 Tax=Punctularia strigosozonata (strain HHB-11173) TaxID=741275 RepID=UPI0004416E77|nr:hexokinase [Punctularia strigosozonata HHB-11173 SS5]EIN10788.1 hexokinase [Punctularia strigosozonata HHB-11173 SS5]
MSARFSKDRARLILQDIEDQFQLDDDALKTITKQFLDDFELGLGKYGQAMAMIPTFVTGVPDGTETGTFLALDLGGTNLRVCEVHLHGNHQFELRQQKYKVSDALKTGEVTALFDYLADSVDAFLTDSGHDFSELDNPFEGPPEIHLGLTFSFPVEQTALDSGTLLTWTKGFAAKNAIGKDVVRLLQDAFDRKHLHVRCVALVNDTVGALLSRSYTAGSCLLGAIFGTGTNGAYLEDVAKITKLKNSPSAAKGGKMVVNTEWGAFNNSRTTLPTTAFDNKLDRESINPRFQAYEKFISGMYLGEITRNILLSLVDAAPKPLLFGGKSTKQLNTHYGFDTAVMSAVEEAWEGLKVVKPEPMPSPSAAIWDFDEAKLDEPTKERLRTIQQVIVEQVGFAPEDVSLQDAAIVRWACSLVAQRAAKLSGCAVATVLAQTGYAKLGGSDSHDGPDKIGVGVDGSLIQHYPNFEAGLRHSLRTLVGETIEKKVEIGMAKDGSGVGAALCALQAAKELARSGTDAAGVVNSK